MSLPLSQTDSVQINAPEYNSDIDGQIDTLPDLQSHAKNNKDEPTPAAGDLEDPKLSQDTNRTGPQTESVQNPAEYLPHQDAEPFLKQHQDRRDDKNIQLNLRILQTRNIIPSKIHHQVLITTLLLRA